ncbi:MAG: hypothetical protein DWQ01_17285 [Planctomycetota bacterium]|nr:MAG: hypothetical protein DWQ01_17285 [Planctomycetota bacterium]
MGSTRFCLAVLAFGFFSLTSCVSFTYNEVAVNQPPAHPDANGLEVGTSTLSDCLLALGAPTEVEEDETGDGAILTWSWIREDGWSLRISIPLTRGVTGSFQYADAENMLRHLRLDFDPNWVLREIYGRENLVLPATETGSTGL